MTARSTLPISEPAHDGQAFAGVRGYISESPLKPTGEAANFPPALDACCGSRMFWFDRADARAVFVDKRSETHVLPDVSSKGGSRSLVISPDIQADFTALPFAEGTFALVVFDPPHLVRSGRKSWLAKKYGKLGGEWREELRKGFLECFRVLRPDGTLIFKWDGPRFAASRGYLALRLVAIPLTEANAYVSNHHRHHKPCVGHKFSIGVHDGERVRGVVIVGRPVSRMADDGETLEVARCCTDGAKNACSMLYGAARRATFALGYKRLITYTLPSEGGVSLRAAGWTLLGEAGGGSWSRIDRPRVDDHPTQGKLKWQAPDNHKLG